MKGDVTKPCPQGLLRLLILGRESALVPIYKDAKGPGDEVGCHPFTPIHPPIHPENRKQKTDYKHFRGLKLPQDTET